MGAGVRLGNSIKFISTYLLGMLIVLACAGVSAQTGPEFTSKERAYIDSAGTLRVGMSPERNPFSEYDAETKTGRVFGSHEP